MSLLRGRDGLKTDKQIYKFASNLRIPNDLFHYFTSFGSEVVQGKLASQSRRNGWTKESKNGMKSQR